MFELIHTSSPRGLFGGSGYTTVAATVGMPEALRKVLESLSGYEQIHDYGVPRFSANPVAFICQPIGQAGGKSWWVLSRIAVADKDYTGRSNYLAHHVALEQNELSQAGPAALAKVFPWTTTWTGEPRALAIRTVPTLNAYSETSSAPAWTSIGLDAGWAGYLAEQARSRRGLIQLVYPAGADPLALVADAVALLPPMERWDARFHTHTSRPRPELAWALFPADVGVSTELVRRPGTVQLGLRPPCPGNGPLVERARGKLPPTPASGGAGVGYFPGHRSHEAVGTAMPVATASESPLHGGDYPRPWDQIPVAKKKTSIAPILHWVGHFVLLVVCLSLVGIMVISASGQKSSNHEPKKEDADANSKANPNEHNNQANQEVNRVADDLQSIDIEEIYGEFKNPKYTEYKISKTNIAAISNREKDKKKSYEGEIEKLKNIIAEKDRTSGEKFSVMDTEIKSLKENKTKLEEEKKSLETKSKLRLNKGIVEGKIDVESKHVEYLVELDDKMTKFVKNVINTNGLSDNLKREICAQAIYKKFDKNISAEMKKGDRNFKKYFYDNINSYCKASDGSDEIKYIKNILFAGINEQLLGGLESQKNAWSDALKDNRTQFEDNQKADKSTKEKEEGKKRGDKLKKLQDLLNSIMANMDKIG